MRGILDYYPVAMAEEEGAGTAYEYFVKARVLERVFRKAGCPKSLLVAGLPERYGYSCDFILLGQDLGCRRLLVLDERPQRLEKLQDICRRLEGEGILDGKMQVDFDTGLLGAGELPEYDLFVSCEVLQRISAADRERYWRRFLGAARAGVVFTPNGENPDHAAHSGLRTVDLRLLREQALRAGGRLVGSGYIDLPPFPPGISRSDEQREAAGQGGFFRMAFWGIEQWARLEGVFPRCWRKKAAHIVYVAAVK